MFSRLSEGETMTDANLLAKRIDASGLSQVRFALDVLACDPSTVRRWLAGKPMPATVSDWLQRAAVSSDPERIRIDVLRP
jgi:uncharacterized protein (DUF1800 family)